MDLCFVPGEHKVSEKIPAVSGSSGRLVGERTKAEAEKEWPGRVFEDEQLSYEEAMLKFVAASPAKETGSQAESQVQTKPTSGQQTKRLLKKEEKQLRNDRCQIREQRKLEDRAWKQARQNRTGANLPISA